MPRRINSEELVRTREPVKSKLVERLIKSEKLLITEILAEEEETPDFVCRIRSKLRSKA